MSSNNVLTSTLRSIETIQGRATLKDGRESTRRIAFVKLSASSAPNDFTQNSGFIKEFSLGMATLGWSSSMFTNLDEAIKYLIGDGLRPKDGCILYILGRSGTKKNENGEIEYIQGLSVDGNDMDIDDAILHQKVNTTEWNGASVYILLDTQHGDLFNTPLNLKYNSDCTQLENVKDDTRDTKFPENVIIISSTIQDDVCGFPRIWYGSYTFKMTFFQRAILDICEGIKWNLQELSIEDFLKQLHKWYRSLCREKLSDKMPCCEKNNPMFYEGDVVWYNRDLMNWEGICCRTPMICCGYNENTQKSIFSIQTGWTPPTNNNGIKKVLLLGCAYKGTKNILQAPNNDTMLIHNMFTDLLKFDKTYIGILNSMNGDIVNEERFRHAMEWFVNGNTEKDTLYFYYSGHGFQDQEGKGNNVNDDKEVDGLNEIIPLDNMFYIYDNEINDYFLKAISKGAQLHAIFDCCHSGTMSDITNTSVIAQGNPPSITGKSTSQENISKNVNGRKPTRKTTKISVVVPPSPKIISLSACCDSDLSREFQTNKNKPLPEVFKWESEEPGMDPCISWMTYHLYHAIKNVGGKVSYKDILIKLKESYNTDDDVRISGASGRPIGMKTKCPQLNSTIPNAENEFLV